MSPHGPCSDRLRHETHEIHTENYRICLFLLAFLVYFELWGQRAALAKGGSRQHDINSRTSMSSMFSFPNIRVGASLASSGQLGV
eukprot:4971423-Amphidinium_carterae.1